MKAWLQKILLLAICSFNCSIVQLFNIPTAAAQSPIANRVKGVAMSLPKGSHEIARYTDERRHCLYYLRNDRIYKYDVIEGTNLDITISPEGYTKLLNVWLSSNKRYLFVAIDRKDLVNTYLEKGQELWRIDSYNGRRRKIGTGYRIRLRRENKYVEKPHFIISKASRCLNNKEALEYKNWMVRDYYFDFSEGGSFYTSDEYRYGTTPPSFPHAKELE